MGWERSMWSARSTLFLGVRGRTTLTGTSHHRSLGRSGRLRRVGLVGVNVPGRVDRRNRHSEVRGLVTGKSAIRRSGPALASSVTGAVAEGMLGLDKV